jgi:sugar phosphate isomerase/epimerase
MRALYLCDNCEFESTALLSSTRGLGIEIQSFYDPSYLPANPDAFSRHRAALAPVRDRSLHGPFGDLCPGSFDPLVRQVARKRFEDAVEAAQALDISQVILHHGYVPGTSPHSKWIARSTEFWRDFLRDKPTHLRFYVENLFDREPGLLSDVMSSINDPRVKVCLDIGHANVYSPGGPVSWILQMKAQIGYVHLHDNLGLVDNHFGFGEGNLPLEDTLRSLEENAADAIWALETDPKSFIRSLDWLADHHFI